MSNPEIRPGVSERVERALSMMVDEGADAAEALNALLAGKAVEEMDLGGDGDEGPLDDEGDDDDGDEDEDD